MRKILAAAALVAGMGLAASAQAADTLNFDVTNIQINVTNGADPWCLGCYVKASPAALPASFTLGDSDSQTFKLGNFWVHGLGFGDASVTATLTFDSPIAGDVNGSGEANYVELFGLFTGGSLVWNAVPTITVGDMSFDVSFQNLAGIQPGHKVADYVTITAHALPGDTATGGVPEPATWALMIGGFGMAGAMLRRRRAVALAA